MTNANNVSRADRLRNDLRLAGFNARRVTVRQPHGTLYVTVRDASVSLSAVKAIAMRHENVRYCQTTGEMLSGGNTFVEVEYARELVEPIAAEIVGHLAPAGDGETVEVMGGFTATKLSRARGATYSDEVIVTGPGIEVRQERAIGIHYAAAVIAIAHLDACALAQAPTESLAS